MLLDTDNEEEAENYCLAMKQFKLIENNDSDVIKEENDGDADYYVEIKIAKRFNLLVDVVVTGLSFRIGNRIMQLVKEHSGIGQYGGCSNNFVSQYIQASCAHSF